MRNKDIIDKIYITNLKDGICHLFSYCVEDKNNVKDKLRGIVILMALNIVLVEPEIPQNTGNIVRTCAATGSILHLVGPLGFSIEDKYLKRAGLDYWNSAEILYHDNLVEFLNKYGNNKLYYSTTKAINKYSDVKFEDDCFILFGKETAGLPEELLKEHKETCIRIPMKESIRSLNLSNSVAIVVYEALRQQNFKNFETEGHLAKYEW